MLYGIFKLFMHMAAAHPCEGRQLILLPWQRVYNHTDALLLPAPVHDMDFRVGSASSIIESTSLSSAILVAVIP